MWSPLGPVPHCDGVPPAMTRPVVVRRESKPPYRLSKSHVKRLSARAGRRGSRGRPSSVRAASDKHAGADRRSHAARVLVQRTARRATSWCDGNMPRPSTSCSAHQPLAARRDRLRDTLVVIRGCPASSATGWSSAQSRLRRAPRFVGARRENPSPTCAPATSARCPATSLACELLAAAPAEVGGVAPMRRVRRRDGAADEARETNRFSRERESHRLLHERSWFAPTRAYCETSNSQRRTCLRPPVSRAAATRRPPWLSLSRRPVASELQGPRLATASAPLCECAGGRSFALRLPGGDGVAVAADRDASRTLARAEPAVRQKHDVGALRADECWLGNMQGVHTQLRPYRRSRGRPDRGARAFRCHASESAAMKL